MILDLYHLKSSAYYLYSDALETAIQNTDVKIKVLLRIGAREFEIQNTDTKISTPTILIFKEQRIHKNFIQLVFEKIDVCLELDRHDLRDRFHNQIHRRIQWYNGDRYYNVLLVNTLAQPLKDETIDFLSAICTIYGPALHVLTMLNGGDLYIKRRAGYYVKCTITTRSIAKLKVFPYFAPYNDSEEYFGVLDVLDTNIKKNLKDLCAALHPGLFEFE